MSSFPSSDFFSSIEPEFKRVMHCEFCGLRYQSTKTLTNHQEKFCTGKIQNHEDDKSDDSFEENNSNYANQWISESYSSKTSLKNKKPNSNSDLNNYTAAIKKMSAGSSSRMKTYVCRFRPNQDLHKELDKFVKENDLKAAFIITCVGSLTKATLRMAYGGGETSERVKVFNKHMEIVSLVGTLSSVGGHHLHMSLSDANGVVIGGHVFGELNVFTTAEVVIGECEDLLFKREFDNQSGFDELEVISR